MGSATAGSPYHPVRAFPYVGQIAVARADVKRLAPHNLGGRLHHRHHWRVGRLSDGTTE